MEFIAEDLQSGLPEKVIICISWFLTETVGNGLLFILIRFDILAGDPLKRRITDQVRMVRLINTKKSDKKNVLVSLPAHVYLLHACNWE